MPPSDSFHSVVPRDSAHRVQGKRTDSYPGVMVDILATRKIELHEWELRRFTDPYWRLYWPLSAGGIVEIDGVTMPLLPGFVYLIPPHTVFSTTMKERFSKWYAHFKLGRPAGRALPGIYRCDPSPELLHTVSQLGIADPDPGFPWLTVQFVGQALRLLPERVWMRQRTDARVLKALDFMSAHLSVKLSAGQIAKYAGLSVRNLNHLFKEELNQAPMRVLLDYRLDEACRQLRGGESSIEEIAEQCGLVNRHYLSRVMRQCRNTSPAAYRDEQVWS
ncbi:MAG: Helix-turn-helix protein [Verrucomicrobiales bacterium]|nr:Helix-turn-helix protein [Verrucomicrobiales bacterium]